MFSHSLFLLSPFLSSAGLSRLPPLCYPLVDSDFLPQCSSASLCFSLYLILPLALSHLFFFPFILHLLLALLLHLSTHLCSSACLSVSVSLSVCLSSVGTLCGNLPCSSFSLLCLSFLLLIISLSPSLSASCLSLSSVSFSLHIPHSVFLSCSQRRGLGPREWCAI